MYIGEILKSLVRSERNQQVMCEAGLAKDIFQIGSSLFLMENPHPLLMPFYYIVERLAVQSMRPKELRNFLRLDVPLCCRDFDDESGNNLPTEGGPVPLNRVKTLVSMVTPRDFRVPGLSMNPPFIEFDMAVEGFGCIYAPSIAPQGISTGNVRSPSIAESTTQIFGGLGSGERVFPPLAGLTFITWLYVEQFSDPR